MKKDVGNRRKFIQKASLSAAGLVFAGNLPSSKSRNTALGTDLVSVDQALTKGSDNIAIRKNITDLPMDDPGLKVLQDAVKILRERSRKWPLDPAGWSENGAMHTKFCATIEFTYQVHYSWYVWPWHRAYLWTLEKKLQYAVREPKLALHYWDWTKYPQLPKQYLGGFDNPLYNDTRLALEKDVIPLDFMNLGPALRTPNFQAFGGHPFPYDGKGPQIDGIAEQSFHNNIHNWIGGEMAGFVTAGYDPIFYGHHGNCDRFWQAWLASGAAHQNPAQEEWLEKTFYFTDEKGKPLEIKVKDLLDTEKLGYRFNDLDFSNRCYAPMEDRIIPTFELVKANAVYSTSIEEEKKNQLIEKVDQNKVSMVLMKFVRAQLPYMPYCARVFFAFGEETSNGQTINYKYVGTFTILPIVSAEKGQLEKDVYMNVEITQSIAEKIRANEEINVLFEPVQVRGREIPDVPLEIKNITFELI